MLSTISRTRLTSNWLPGFVPDSQTLLPAVPSSVLAFTAIFAFIVFPSKGILSFTLQQRGAVHEKQMPFMAGESA
jgi:hypothetical protein